MPTPTYTIPDYPNGLSEFASPQGPRENFLDAWLKVLMGESAATTPQTGNIQNILAGVPVMTEQAIRTNKKAAKRRFEHDQAATRESFGRQGARFGTDLTGDLSRNAENFRLGLSAQDANQRMTMANDARNRSLQALQTILGGSQFSTGLEFTRGESAAQRQIEKILQELRNAGALDVAALEQEGAMDRILAEIAAGGGI